MSLDTLRNDLVAALTNTYPDFSVRVTGQLVFLSANYSQLITLRAVNEGGYAYVIDIVQGELLDFSSDGTNYYWQQAMGQDIVLNWDAVNTAITNYYNSL